MHESEPANTSKSLGSHASSDPSGEIGSNGPALGVVGQTESGTISDQPSAVPPAAGSLRDVHAALTQRPGHDPKTGRFVGGRQNDGGGQLLARSTRFWNAVESLKRDLVQHVRTDLAVDDNSVSTLLGLIDGYAEARLFRSSMFLRLVDAGGPISNKGKTRALYRAYLDALDRETKLAQVLGIERKSKPVKSLAEVMAGHDE